MANIDSGYLNCVYDLERFRIMLARFTQLLEQHHDRFDAIAFRGSSGAAVAYHLSLALNKPLIYVRKPTESSHGWGACEGIRDAARYCIVDDIIASGDTMHAIMSGIKEWSPESVCTEIFLYNSSRTEAFLTRDCIHVPVFTL